MAWRGRRRKLVLQPGNREAQVGLGRAGVLTKGFPVSRVTRRPQGQPADTLDAAPGERADPTYRWEGDGTALFGPG